MKKIIIKSMTFLMLLTLIGCSARISPAQMTTVKDPALDGVSTDLLGGSDTTSTGSSLPYPAVGGGAM